MSIMVTKMSQNCTTKKLFGIFAIHLFPYPYDVAYFPDNVSWNNLCNLTVQQLSELQSKGYYAESGGS
jgi:hypothetical protein